MRLYHRTTVDSARAITETADWNSNYPNGDVWFSNRPFGQAEGYGTAVVEVEVPDDILNLDDEFPDGELHFYVRGLNLKRVTVVADDLEYQPTVVDCDEFCGALCEPVTLDDYKRATAHWKSHGLHYGCSHGC